LPDEIEIEIDTDKLRETIDEEALARTEARLGREQELGVRIQRLECLAWNPSRRACDL